MCDQCSEDEPCDHRNSSQSEEFWDDKVVLAEIIVGSLIGLGALLWCFAQYVGTT